MSSAQHHRREALRASGDEQSLIARTRLVTAFHAAAEERVERPSVTWICRRAGVARSTFYTHFAAVDDLATSTLEDVLAAASEFDIRERSAANPDRAAIARVGLGRMLDAFEDSRLVLDYAMHIGPRGVVLERLVARSAAFIRRTIDAEYDGSPDPVRSLVADYVSAGATHAVLQWMATPTPMPRDELLDQLVSLLPTPLTRASRTTTGPVGAP